ncbi:MAG TPA: ATP-binding cassette domain-containing protein [Thermoanaerobaculia bacterium]|jgi:ABC-2 type transport system ATP-binding protein|nr:ATP-binding cassette domain-containing protein [Thermoanaerobaculia bacterium]
MLEAHSLVRRYGDFTAVRDVSFTVQEGEILGMLGPNGAGKTTTLRMLTGYLRPTEGSVRVAGHDLAAAPIEARRQIGYLPENVALYPEMRVDEYLAYRGRLERLSRAELKRRIPEVLDRCLIADVRRQIIGTLSKGYRQRVGLAAAILHEPQVLVLDEPTVGLDPKQIIAIRRLIRELGRDRTLLLSTHILPEVELLCQRVLIIDKGRIVDQGTPESLRERWRGNHRVRVLLKDDPTGAGDTLAALPGITAAQRDEANPGRWLLDGDGSADPREPIFRLAVERGWVLLELVEEKVSLEDIFVRLTTQDAAEAPEHAAGSNGSGNEPSAATGDDASAEEPAS